MPAVTQLGYLVFEVSDLAAWRQFATGVLGLGIAPGGDSGSDATSLRLRMDGHAYRFILQHGPADDLVALGWEVAGADALLELGARLEQSGCPVREASPAEAAARGVERMLCFTDPAGIPAELYSGPTLASEPFRSPVVASGFVADELGLGHAVISARDKAESTAFYSQLLGFSLSDHITCEVYGYPVDIAFFHANPRHHTIAFGGQHDKRIHHFMLEVGSMDDVGLCYDRLIRSSGRIANTLGRHPNDRMFSFYAFTPSGFQFECGWGGRTIDGATWQPTTYDHISEWGHHPPQILAPRRKAPPATE